MNNIRSSTLPCAWLGIFATAILCACTVGPDFVRPAAPDASRYTLEPLPASTVTADGQTQRFMSGAEIAKDWWRLFKSEPLNAVVQQAISNNQTLQVAEANLRQSQDNLRAGYGVFFPQISAGADASRQRAVPLQQGLQTPGSIFNLFTLSGVISYAIDVFGGTRRTVEGLQAQVDDQRYASKAAYVTLSANVVNTSIARAAYISQDRATEQLINIEKEQIQITEEQVRAGVAPYSNLLSLRGLIAANKASLAPLKQKISQTEHLLATLEGVVPTEVSLPDVQLSELSLPVDLPVSLPSDLVRQRPDILSAEAQMHVASANIGVATAAMFPSFSLSGSYGTAGSSPANLLSSGSSFWDVGSSVLAPLYRGGSLWYGRKAAIDAYQASQANYRQTVLDAFAQVADTLNALEHDAEALQAQLEAQHATREALTLLQVNYRAGLAAYIDVLTADVQYHQSTVAYLQAVAQRSQDTVALFVALGGGWWNGKSSSGEGSGQ